MPTYQFRCKDCGREVERQLPWSEASSTQRCDAVLDQEAHAAMLKKAEKEAEEDGVFKLIDPARCRGQLERIIALTARTPQAWK